MVPQSLYRIIEMLQAFRIFMDATKRLTSKDITRLERLRDFMMEGESHGFKGKRLP